MYISIWKYETYLTAFGSRVDFGILELAWKESYHQVIQKLWIEFEDVSYKDHLIHCFKEGQPYANGSDMLKEQQNLLPNAEYLNSKPFEITESGTRESNTNNNLIDSSDSEDDLIDIKL